MKGKFEEADLDTITWDDFMRVGLHVGTIVRAEPFPEARKAAYKLWIDLGEKIGVKQSSAQITVRYQPSDLIGRQVLCVINLGSKQVGPFRSEVLTTGAYDTQGNVVLLVTESPIPNGSRLL